MNIVYIILILCENILMNCIILFVRLVDNFIIMTRLEAWGTLVPISWLVRGVFKLEILEVFFYTLFNPFFCYLTSHIDLAELFGSVKVSNLHNGNVYLKYLSCVFKIYHKKKVSKNILTQYETKIKRKQAGAELCQAQLPTGILLNCD